MITNQQKQQIITIAKEQEPMLGSGAKLSKFLGINPAQWSRIKNGELDNVLGDAKWVSIAIKLGINTNTRKQWKTANTPIFQFVTAQLSACQRGGLSSMLCDMSDIGKTYTAEVYAQNNKNVSMVDCSQAKSKQQLIRAIANGFGIGGTGRYSELYADLVAYVKGIETPLIILDEAGDLSRSAFLEIKALWNAVSRYCGFYMIGADGLEALMKRSIEYKVVGFTELFSRFGKRYGSIFRADNYTGNKALQQKMTDRDKVLNDCAAMIIKANMADNVDVNRVLLKTKGDDNHPSLRRIERELSKIED